MAYTQLIIDAPGTVVRHMGFNWHWIFYGLLIIAVWIAGSGTLFYIFEAVRQNALKDVPPFGWFETYYFTVINITTVGFGDIVPRTDGGHWIAMANSLFGLIAFGWLIAVFTIALQPASSPPGEVKVVLDPALLLKLFEHFSRDADPAPIDKPRRRLIIELDE